MCLLSCWLIWLRVALVCVWVCACLATGVWSVLAVICGLEFSVFDALLIADCFLLFAVCVGDWFLQVICRLCGLFVVRYVLVCY